MKQVWWKVPVYCIAAGFISFQLMVHLLGRFTIVTLPDGSISTDQTRWLILSGVIFVFTVGIGGFFFRKMTRREIFCSATILVLCNIVFGLLSFKSNHILTLLLMYWMEANEWSSFIPQLLNLIQTNLYISAVVTWFAPYLFIFFGKKERKES